MVHERCYGNTSCSKVKAIIQTTFIVLNVLYFLNKHHLFEIKIVYGSHYYKNPVEDPVCSMVKLASMATLKLK